MEQNFIIEPLSPARLDDFLAFFDGGLPEGEWGHRCYCAAFCGKDNCSTEGMELAENRRREAIGYVNEGSLRGYLAYLDGRVVGWCNANDRNASRLCFGFRYIIGKELPETAEKTKSVFCFEVVPDMRGKHVATALLERVMEDARAEGYAYAEAYPLKGDADVLENYCGHREFYFKHGFEAVDETETRLIVRKKL